jgi:hypothetical protein
VGVDNEASNVSSWSTYTTSNPILFV